MQRARPRSRPWPPLPASACLLSPFSRHICVLSRVLLLCTISQGSTEGFVQGYTRRGAPATLQLLTLQLELREGSRAQTPPEPNAARARSCPGEKVMKVVACDLAWEGSGLWLTAKRRRLFPLPGTPTGQVRDPSVLQGASKGACGAWEPPPCAAHWACAFRLCGAGASTSSVFSVGSTSWPRSCTAAAASALPPVCLGDDQHELGVSGLRGGGPSPCGPSWEQGRQRGVVALLSAGLTPPPHWL